MSTSLTAQRGVSLIEALMALLVMAFGMLGIVGMQSTMRLNSDVAKQRSEAVRLAQQAIEDARSFVSVASPVTGVANYSTIASAVQSINASSGYLTNYGIHLAGFNTNTGYTLTSSVIESPAGGVMNLANPRLKTVNVQVSWIDRTGANIGGTPCTDSTANQCVILNATMARVMPELEGTVALAAYVDANGLPTRPPTPANRNLSIPFQAVDLGNGTSSFTPPGTSGIAWIFDNTTGVITITGDTLCGSGNCYLLSGYVQFATGTVPDGRSESPSSAALALSVRVNQTTSASGGFLRTVNCYTGLSSNYVSYYCAIPAAATSPFVWFGRSELYGLLLSSALADTTASNFKVCRYTPERGVVNGVDKGDFPSTGNVGHPLDYAAAKAALINQNFLVISAGDGGATPYDCPADDTSTPDVNGNTWRHQPHS